MPGFHELSRGSHFAVSGESYRQEAILSLLPLCVPHPAEDNRPSCDVSLIAEPHNEYDRNAVGVHGATGQVGYLPRSIAADFAPVFAELARLGFDGGRCGALIMGDETSTTPLGVVLLLSAPNVCLDQIRAMQRLT
jgi:hypothetical protein